jgi:hypothetical protein
MACAPFFIAAAAANEMGVTKRVTEMREEVNVQPEAPVHQNSIRMTLVKQNIFLAQAGIQLTPSFRKPIIRVYDR